MPERVLKYQNLPQLTHEEVPKYQNYPQLIPERVPKDKIVRNKRLKVFYKGQKRPKLFAKKCHKYP